MILISFTLITLLFFAVLTVYSYKKSVEGNKIYAMIFGVLTILILGGSILFTPISEKHIILDDYLYEIYTENGTLKSHIEHEDYVYSTSSGVKYLEDDCEVILVRDVSAAGIFTGNDSDYNLFIKPKK